MIEQTFKSGNYNIWDNFVTNILPQKNIVFRQEIIPLIDKILVSMLGSNNQIEKTQVDVEQICNSSKKGLEALLYKLTYTIDDFLAPDAPQDAILKDEESIRNALTRDDFHLKTIKIDTNKGTLYLEFETFLGE